MNVDPFRPPAPTIRDIAHMPPSEQGVYLEPLRALGNAAGSVGSGEARAYFCGVALDAPQRLVYIYLTDLDRSDDFLAAVMRVDPDIDTRMARFMLGRYTRDALDAATKRLWGLRSQVDFTIESTSQPADGSALWFSVDDVDRARQALAEPLTGSGVSLATLIGVATVVEPARGIRAEVFRGGYLRDGGEVEHG